MPTEPTPELNSSRTSSNNNTKVVKSVVSPSLPNLPRIISIRDCNKPGAQFCTFDLIQKTNSNRSRVLKSSKPPTHTSKRSENLESKTTSCFNTNAPPVKRNKSSKLPGSRSFKPDVKSIFENNPSFLKLFTHQISLRRCISEPCFVLENETTKTYLYQRRNSERLISLVEDAPLLRIFEMETTKKPVAKLVNGTSRSRNCTKNVQKPAQKLPNPVPCPRLVRTTRPSIFESKKMKKINQGTQVESQTTKEVESQTDFKKDIDRPARRKKQTPPPDEKDSNKPMKKTVVIPFSFMDRCQAYLERKQQRMIDKKYELKRWATPALILQKKPYKLVLPEIKTTVPKTVSFETDHRREKWQKYMKEFNERQEKLQNEKQSVKQTELRKFRKTLIPKIHKVPYKKLGIKPRKPITSPFRKLREQTKESNARHNLRKKDKYSMKGKKDTKDNTKLNKKHTKTNSSNYNQFKQKSTKNNKILTQNIEIEFRSSRKNPSKTNNKNSANNKTSINQKIAITIGKRNPNIMNSPISSPNRNSTQIKISSPSKNDLRRNYSALVKDNFRGNAIIERDHYDGLYERCSSPSLSSISSKRSYTIIPAMKTPRRVF